MLTKCNWHEINGMINNASLNFIHKKSYFSLFKNVENRRSVVAINLTYRPKKHDLKKFFLYKGLKFYNDLPNKIKILDKAKFKTQTKRYEYIHLIRR